MKVQQINLVTGEESEVDWQGEIHIMPTTGEESEAVTHEAVFGSYPDDVGMVVASGYDNDICPINICPIFGDRLPWRSVTVVCRPEEEAGVMYRLSCQHGGPDNISLRKVLADGRVALRSNYMAW